MEYEKPLKCLFNDLWNDSTNSYNKFLDYGQGKVRAEALKIKDKHTLWMRNLGESLTDILELPRNQFMELSKVSNMLTHVIITLNDIENRPSKKDQKKLLESLVGVARITKMIQDQIDIDLNI